MSAAGLPIDKNEQRENIKMAQTLPSHKTKAGGARHYSRLPAADPQTKGSADTEHDNWLDRSPEALADVQRGLADSAAGRGVKMSFLEYADVEIDE